MITDQLAEQEFQRILLIKPSSLGDVVHALPVLHALRQRYPRAHLAWLVARSFAPLIRNHPDLDEIIEFDRSGMRGLVLRRRANRTLRDLLRSLRAGQFDLVVDLQGLFRSGFFARATRAAVRIGFASARELAPVFYTHRVETDDPQLHAVDRYMLVAKRLGCADQPPAFDLALTDQERIRAAELLAGAGVTDGATFAAVLPAARWETKQWLPDRFAATLDRIAEQHALPSVILGTSAEADRCRQVVELARHPTANLCGQTDLRTLTAVLERAAIVLCHDSGPLHLAAALNRPLVCISGPTNPNRTGPFQRLEDVLRLDLPCSPCYLKRIPQCNHGHECMRGIDVDHVVNRLELTLERSG